MVAAFMRLTRRHILLGAGLGAGSLALPGQAWAATGAGASVRGVSLTDMGADGVRVAVALTRQAEARTLFLSGPDRFVVDIADARWSGAAQAGQGAGAGLVSRYRYGPRPDGAVRLVLDLDGPARVTRQSLGGSARPGLSFDLAAHASRSAAPAPITPARPPAARRIIVLDPGHGGQDPGAIGVTGVREKDVVLDAALKLKAALEARGRYQVHLTRANDSFIPLPDRVAFARTHNADLFISLHADSHANPEACGASVYTLSERGANRAQSMMTAQNWDIDVGAAPRGGVVGAILRDLTQRETTNRSALFAETAIHGLSGVAPVLENGHRNAGFYVLLAPDVPAVLIETGFLSNVQDERRLSSPRSREAIADSLAGSIDNFFGAPVLYASA